MAGMIQGLDGVLCETEHMSPGNRRGADIVGDEDRILMKYIMSSRTVCRMGGSCGRGQNCRIM